MVLSGGHAIGFSASTNPQVHPHAVHGHVAAHIGIQQNRNMVAWTSIVTALPVVPPLQGTISSNDRYFSNKYYKQIILGDAFFGSDRALADSNLTLPLVQVWCAVLLCCSRDSWYSAPNLRLCMGTRGCAAALAGPGSRPGALLQQIQPAFLQPHMARSGPVRQKAGRVESVTPAACVRMHVLCTLEGQGCAIPLLQISFEL